MRHDAVVLITGASRGIGRATAVRFARSGARLVLAARDGEQLERLAEKLRERAGAKVSAHATDVSLQADVDALVSNAMAHYGRIDVLVNAAGGGLYGRIEETSEADFQEVLETNLLGTHRVTRAVLPHMRGQGSGHIVTVGSVVGKRSWAFHGAYSASKFALVGFTQALRAELAGSGVTATLVLPANTRTDFFRAAKVLTPGYEPKPLGAVQRPGRVARAIVRSVDHPSPEINVVPAMRGAMVLAEAFPALADRVAAAYYRWIARRL